MSNNNNNGWMPIESAPKDGSGFLAFINKDWIEGVFWNGRTWSYLSDGEITPDSRSQPTHWQPMPSPPGEIDVTTHNKQQGFTAADMADQYATAFERGRESVLAEQAAAAQEAVAYLDIGAGGYLDIGSDLPEEQLLALPNGRHALGIIGTYGIDGYVSAPVAAAPGIGLQWLVEGLDEIGSLSCNLRQGGCDTGDLEGLENGLMHAVDMAHQLRDRLLALIDASPKDALPTLPDDFSESKDWRAGNYAERIEWLLDTVRSQRGHIDALLDSPKGGSDARDAARWRYVRRKLCLTGNGDGTCGMQAINLPGSIPGWPDTSDDVVGFCEAAIDAAMQAQAGDAEVSND